MHKTIVSVLIFSFLLLFSVSAQANTVPSQKCVGLYERLIDKYHKGFNYYEDNRENRIVYKRLYAKGCTYSPEISPDAKNVGRPICHRIAADSNVYLNNVANRVGYRSLVAKMKRYEHAVLRAYRYQSYLKVQMYKAQAGMIEGKREVRRKLNRVNRNIHSLQAKFDRHQARLIVRLRPYAFHVDLNTVKAVSARCVDTTAVANGRGRGPVAKVFHKYDGLQSYASAAIWGRYDYYYEG